MQPNHPSHRYVILDEKPYIWATKIVFIVCLLSQQVFSDLFHISIPSCETEQDNEGYYICYKVIMKTQFSSVEIKRRYRHFRIMHQDLVQLVGVQLPRLPNNRTTGTAADGGSYDHTRLSLQQYLVLLASIPKVWKFSPFIDFMDCRHPFLSLQIYVATLADDVANLRQENMALFSLNRNMQQSLHSATDAIKTLQGQVSNLLEDRHRHGGSHHDHQEQSRTLPVGYAGVTRLPNQSHSPRDNNFRSFSNSIDSNTPYPSHHSMMPSTTQVDSPSWSPSNHDIYRKFDSGSSHTGTPTQGYSSRNDVLPIQTSLSSKSSRDEDCPTYKPLSRSEDNSEGPKSGGYNKVSSPAGTKKNKSPPGNSLASRQQERKVGSAVKPSRDSQYGSAFLHPDVIKEFILDPALLDASSELVQMVLPNMEQLLYRYNIEKYIAKLVRKSLGAQLFQTGFSALRCFLPDDAITLSVYLCRGLEHSWYIRLNEKLSRMSTGGTVTTENDETEGDIDGATNIECNSPLESPPLSPSKTSPKNQELISNSNGVPLTVEPPQHSLSSYPIKNVAVIRDDIESILQCVVGVTTVDIRANVKADLCFPAFIEEIDACIGRNHLFKKSLSLVRAWWVYESPKYADDLFNPDIIPKVAICIMVCALFNIHADSISGPMHVLLLFLAEFSDFDWNLYDLTVFGRVKRDLLEPQSFTSFVARHGHVFSANIIRKYQNILHGSSRAMEDYQTTTSHESDLDVFTLFERVGNDKASSTPKDSTHNSEIRIYHPLDPKENVISANLLPSNVETFEKIMQGAASRMNNILQRSSRLECDLAEELRDFFTVTFNRFGSGWRPDTLNNQTDSQGTDGYMSYLAGSTEEEGAGGVTTASKKAGNNPFGGNDTSDQEFNEELGPDPLLIQVDVLTDRIRHCNFLLEAEVTEPVLQRMSKDILQERGSLPVGEIGKMLQEITGISTLSAYLKEKYGGLKKFLEQFEDDFVISVDHPFNPHVFLRNALTREDIATIAGGTIPMHLSSKANKRRLSRRKRLSSQSSSVSDRSSPSPYHVTIERSQSASFYEPSSSHSRGSLRRQHSFGHSTKGVTSTSNSFYGNADANRSYSPPPQGQYVSTNNHHQHFPSNHGDRQRSYQTNDGWRDRHSVSADRDDYYTTHMHQKSAPSQYHLYARNNSNSADYLDENSMRRSAPRNWPQPGYIPHDANYRGGRI